jgi:hypothetical protein
MAKTNYSPTFPMYPGDAAAVTTSDTVSFPTASIVFVGSGGTVRVLTAQGSDVTFVGLLAGSILPVQVIQVFATTTTATNMVRIF